MAILTFASPVQKEPLIVNSSASTNNVIFNETQTNASQSNWNITFGQEGNQTFYITLPKNANVTSAQLNLSGFKAWNFSQMESNFSVALWSDSIYQLANNGTHIWVTWQLLSAGLWRIYTIGGVWATSWNPFSFPYFESAIYTNNTYLWIHDPEHSSINRYFMNKTNDYNFSLHASNDYPSGIVVADDNVYVTDSTDKLIYKYAMDGTFIKTINVSECKPYDIAHDGSTFYIGDFWTTRICEYDNYGESYTGTYSTFDSANGHNVIHGITYYNGAIWISDSDPVALEDLRVYKYSNHSNSTNPYLDVGGDGDQEWVYSGEFNHTQNRTSDFSSEMNDYISSCTPDAEGNCIIPMILHSDTAGKIQVSAINITYTYNASALFTEDSNSDNYYWNQTSGIVAGSQYIKHFRITNTSNITANNITVSGYYLKNQTATKCYINGTEYTPTGSPKYCPFEFTISQGQKWLNHNISDKPLAIAITISESSYVQDASKQTESGANNYSYITSNITLTNPSDTGEGLSGTYSRSARSGWTCNLGCSGAFSLSDGASVINITNQSKLNIITKTEKITVKDTEFTTDIIANTSINSVDYYYWNTTLELNNTDPSINYTNVRWYNYLQGSNFNYEQNISGGTLSQLNCSDPTNVTTRFRTASVKTTEEVIDTGSAYEKDITVTCPDNVDQAFVSNYYTNVLVNATISTEYTNYNFYWWNGVAWEKHTETVWYDFTMAEDYSWGSFKTNCSVNYYAISSETPKYQPESPPAGSPGGAEPIIKIVSGNWSIIQPNFYLLVAPGSEVVSHITIDNRMNTEIEYVNLTCIPSTCKPNDPCSCVDLCPYVTFGEKLIQIKGKPFFQVYEIPPGQSGKAPFYINFTSAYAQDHDLPEIQSCFYSFSIKVTIGEVSNPVNVQVIALPGMKQIGEGLTWLGRKTLIIPGKYPVYIPNWLLLVIAIIVSILLLVGLVKILR